MLAELRDTNRSNFMIGNQYHTLILKHRLEILVSRTGRGVLRSAVKPIQREYVEILGVTPCISGRPPCYQVQLRRDKISVSAVVVYVVDAKLKEC